MSPVLVRVLRQAECPHSKSALRARHISEHSPLFEGCHAAGAQGEFRQFPVAEQALPSGKVSKRAWGHMNFLLISLFISLLHYMECLFWRVKGTNKNFNKMEINLNYPIVKVPNQGGIRLVNLKIGKMQEF